MELFTIRGGKPLSGIIPISGSKNAALPIIAATVLNSGITRLYNVPMIQDVLNLCEILRLWGSRITVDQSAHAVTIDNSKLVIQINETIFGLVRKLRGSILLVGSILAKFGSLTIPLPGGDIIGARPLDVHFDGFQSLGAEINQTGETVTLSVPKGLTGSSMVLKEPSVTATENLIMAAAGAKGETTIKLAAIEPHVQDLCHFLEKFGVGFDGIGTHWITILGKDFSSWSQDIEYTIIPDSDEAMNLSALVAATRSEVDLRGIRPEYCEAGINKLQEIGVNVSLVETSMIFRKPTSGYRAAKYQCGLYPKLMSDQIPPFAVLATQANGVSMIQEWMYEGRLGYVTELSKMGANAMILDPHRAIIVGPTSLRGAELKSLDIRAGMTMIVAGLVAEGETTILDAQIIDRGFEAIDNRLRAIGADIIRSSK
ncbi:MAG: UDP-N-acetylglucosamine 1-carboxyvinyltransferase [Parcubacteria group bacterium GW2011_GWA1_45_7]|nr:MAG: UDP-N-acetylglucosamine 1-carboxyvinyltransferase [Parcubacteria group bacterium GW2011_GWA1_45_7]